MRGVGTDIIEIERIQGVLERSRESFLEKILTPAEIEYCMSYKDYALPVAGRFAAKEAVAKALGCGFGELLSFHDMEILNDAFGKPIVHLSREASERFHAPTIHLSISHCKSHAVAFAIAL